MQVNVRNLEAWFAEFNANYFGNELPTPVFSVGNSRTRLGSLSWETHRRLFSKTVSNYTMRISNYFNVTEFDFKNVLLHEMIHLYIVSKGIKDTSPHGMVFCKMMRKINAFGWKITVSERMNSRFEVADRYIQRTRLVMAVVTNDGKHLLSVVNPSYVRRINVALKTSPNIKSCTWFITDNAFFATYPVVRTPKGRIVSELIFNQLVNQMKPFEPSK